MAGCGAHQTYMAPDGALGCPHEQLLLAFGTENWHVDNSIDIYKAALARSQYRLCYNLVSAASHIHAQDVVCTVHVVMHAAFRGLPCALFTLKSLSWHLLLGKVRGCVGCVAGALAHAVHKVMEALAKAGNLHAPLVALRKQKGPPEVWLRKGDGQKHAVALQHPATKSGIISWCPRRRLRNKA